MSAPRLLDLFCKAGGAAKGYQRAGFYVVGVDIEPQPRYAGDEFIQADALTFNLKGFDAVHASPPCQAFTAYKRRPGHVAERLNLIPAIRERLRAWRVPYVIENVHGAPLINAVRFCGSSFGLNVRRHRYFESNCQIAAPPCNHGWQTPRFAPASNRTNLRSTVEVGVWRIPLDVQQRAMDIEWMTREELSQAIPPAYTEHIGWQIMHVVGSRPAA